MDRVRIASVEAGRVRCQVLELVPGVPGTSLQLESALARIDPRALAADVDVHDVLACRRAKGHAPLPFGAEVVRRALERRGDEVEVQNPYQWAARHCRDRGVPFVPLVPERARPGFFERRRLARDYAEAAARLPEDAPPAALAELWPDVARRDPSYRERLDAHDAEVWRRFRDLVAREQAVRVVVLARPPLASRLASRLEAEVLPKPAREGLVAVETAALEPSEVGKGLH